jgi:microcystin-dependent protein
VAQGFVVPFPQRLFDADGLPAVSWQVETFTATGSFSTPITTWSDSALTSANTNPVITDASGYLRIFVAAGTSLDLRVKNAAGVTQFTFLSLQPMPDTSGSIPTVTAVPTGGIIAFGAAAAPTGFLLCNGSLVSRTTYAALFAVISTAYGVGDGTTTFGLPDFRGRYPMGVAASGTGNTLGATFGTIDHLHTGPSHTHSVVVTRSGWGATLNSPSTDGTLNSGSAAGVGEFASSYQPTADLTVTSAAGGTGNTGTANPPTLTCYFVIKT